jgi:GxxExxY protein
MLAADSVLIKNKAVQSLVQAHESQLVNYLAITGIEIGLFLNFGALSLQVKRKYRTYRAKGETAQWP